MVRDAGLVDRLPGKVRLLDLQLQSVLCDHGLDHFAIPVLSERRQTDACQKALEIDG
jgi:hypothetical protein